MPQLQESPEDVAAGSEDVTAGCEVSAAEVATAAADVSAKDELMAEHSQDPRRMIPRRRLSAMKLAGKVLPSQFADSDAWLLSPPQLQDSSLGVGAVTAEVAEQGVVVVLVIQEVSVATSGLSSDSSVEQSSVALASAEVTVGM